MSLQFAAYQNVKIESLNESDDRARVLEPMSLEEIRRSTHPPLRVRLQAGIFHYFNGLGHRPYHTINMSVPSETSVTITQLSEALRAAGIDTAKLERSADNAIRVAVVASLVQTLTPAIAPRGHKRAVPALSRIVARRLSRQDGVRFNAQNGANTVESIESEQVRSGLEESPDVSEANPDETGPEDVTETLVSLFGLFSLLTMAAVATSIAFALAALRHL